MVSFFADVKIFSFWPKTMDYSQVFWPTLSSFVVVFLLFIFFAMRRGHVLSAIYCTNNNAVSSTTVALSM